MISKKSAPQRNVLGIDRIGNWGNVEYHHRLSCGHTDIRKRAATAPQIACVKCVIGEEMRKELLSLTIIPPPATDENWEFSDMGANEEITVARLRAGIASFLGCSNDDVEVVSEINTDGVLVVQFVTIFLSANQAWKLVKTGIATIDVEDGDM